MKIRYTYKLRPGRQAAAVLLREAGLCRWVWNQAAEAWKSGQPRLSDKHLTGLRKTNDWLKAGSVVPQQQVLRDFYQAKSPHRNYKSKRDNWVSLNYTRNGFTLKTVGGRLRLCVAKCPPIPVVWSRPLPSEPSSVRVCKDRCGDWWASFVVNVNDEPLPGNDLVLGVDWGVKAVATTNLEEYDLPHSGHGRQAQQQVAVLSRRMARKKLRPGQEASGHYRRLRRRKAVLQRHTARQRLDDAHKWAKRCVDMFGVLAVEDYRHPTPGTGVRRKDRNVNRAAYDAAVAVAKRVLVSKAERAGRKVVMVDPAYTSQVCSQCGATAKTALGLRDRVYECGRCGLILGRDVNAARNMIHEAGRVLGRVENVRPDGATALLAV